MLRSQSRANVRCSPSYALRCPCTSNVAGVHVSTVRVTVRQPRVVEVDEPEAGVLVDHLLLFEPTPVLVLALHDGLERVAVQPVAGGEQTIDPLPAPPPLGLPGNMFPKNFDASTTCSRRPGRVAKKSPRIFSE
jgi:hypothetical protein